MADNKIYCCRTCGVTCEEHHVKSNKNYMIKQNLPRVIDEYYELANYIVEAGEEMFNKVDEAQKKGKAYKCPSALGDALCAYLSEEELSLKILNKEAEAAKKKTETRSKKQKDNGPKTKILWTKNKAKDEKEQKKEKSKNKNHHKKYDDDDDKYYDDDDKYYDDDEKYI